MLLDSRTRKLLVDGGIRQPATIRRAKRVTPPELRAPIWNRRCKAPDPCAQNGWKSWLMPLPLEFGYAGCSRPDRPEHFKTGWSAKANRLAGFLNPTRFSHPPSADGFTLSHPDAKIRQFWIDHCSQPPRLFNTLVSSSVRRR